MKPVLRRVLEKALLHWSKSNFSLEHQKTTTNLNQRRIEEPRFHCEKTVSNFNYVIFKALLLSMHRLVQASHVQVKKLLPFANKISRTQLLLKSTNANFQLCTKQISFFKRGPQEIMDPAEKSKKQYSELLELCRDVSYFVRRCR